VGIVKHEMTCSSTGNDGRSIIKNVTRGEQWETYLEGKDAMTRGDPASEQEDDNAFGQYLRAQRQLARLSLRQLAGLAEVSDAYLSQIERGLHLPSVGIIRSLAESLHISTEDLLAQAAGVDPDSNSPVSTEDAIRDDPKLDTDQKNALLAVYRSMISEAT
jgi:transcriptional regulator with XRE-family HTH domain